MFIAIKKPVYDKADEVSANRAQESESIAEESFFDLQRAVENLGNALNSGDKAAAQEALGEVKSSARQVGVDLGPVRRGRPITSRRR